MRAIFRESPHQPALVIGVFKAVEKHVIGELAVAETITIAGAVQQIGRVAHALHATRKHDGRASRRKLVMRQHDRLHA
ncbi:hypothetical protein D3C80_1496780 [compost metagenome]